MTMSNTNTAIVKGSLAACARASGKTLAESFLSVDAILLVDCSASMSERDAPGEQSRYHAACAELAKLQEQLPGKLAVVAFSSSTQFCPSGKPDYLGGMTDMAAALRFIKPADGCGIRFVLISDGEPDSVSETLKVAGGFSTRIDTVFVGPEDGAGREFLRKLSAMTGGISAQQDTDKLNLLSENVTRLLTA